MKKQIDPTLWRPIITKHPELQKTYRRSEPNIFNSYQPLSERYEIPGLMPKAPRKPRPDFKPY